MPRKRKTADEAAEVKRKAEVLRMGQDLLGPLRPRSTKRSTKARGIAKAVAAKLVREVDAMLEAGTLGDLAPRYWVALFCWMHEAIYDVSCVEEVRGEWNVASSRASAMLAEEFDGDEEAFLVYVKWVANREEQTELWRRSNRKPGRRLGWRDFFMLKRKLTDYRLDEARRKGPQ